MSDENKKNDDRLESMLRRWGSDEAARTVQVSQAPAVGQAATAARAGAGRQWSIGRRIAWSAAAAVILSVVSTSFYFLGVKGGSRNAEVAAKQTQNDTVIETNRKIKSERDAATQSLAEAQHKIAAQDVQLNGYRNDIEKLKDDDVANKNLAILEAKKLSQTQPVKTTDDQAAELAIARQQAKNIQQKLAELQDKFAKNEQDAANATQKLAQAEKELAIARSKAKDTESKLAELQSNFAMSERDLVDARQKLIQADKEVARLEQVHQDSLAAVKNIEAQPAAAKNQPQTTFQEIQDAVLAGALAGESRTGKTPQLTDFNRFRARQLLAFREQLTKRAKAAGAEAKGEQTARLIERLEAVITRIELLDAANTDSPRQLANLLADGQLLAELNAAIKTSDEPAAVKIWLTQTKLVLWGADHVA